MIEDPYIEFLARRMKDHLLNYQPPNPPWDEKTIEDIIEFHKLYKAPAALGFTINHPEQTVILIHELLIEIVRCRRELEK